MAQTHSRNPDQTIQTLHGRYKAQEWSYGHGPLSQHREHAGMFRTGADCLSVPPQQPEKAAQVHVGDDRDAYFSGRR